MGKNRQMSDADRSAILGTPTTAVEAPLDEQTTAETVTEGTGETTGVTETQGQEETTSSAELMEAPQTAQQGVEDTVVTQEQAPAPAVIEEPKAEVAAVVATTPVVVATTPVAPSNTFGAVGGRVMSVLATYADKMAPRKPVTDALVIEQQRLLFEALSKTINDSEGDFEALMKAVMAWFEQHRAGVCHETRLFRGMDNIPLSVQDRSAFQRLLNMFKLLSEPQGRKLAIKQVDLNTTLQYGVTENGKNRVMNFFHQ